VADCGIVQTDGLADFGEGISLREIGAMADPAPQQYNSTRCDPNCAEVRRLDKATVAALQSGEHIE
jgi:hypothetical protein